MTALSLFRSASCSPCCRSTWRSRWSRTSSRRSRASSTRSTSRGTRTSGSSKYLYREVQLDFSPEMEVFYKLFERCHTQNGKRSLKHHIKWFNFRKVQLDHHVRGTTPLRREHFFHSVESANIYALPLTFKSGLLLELGPEGRTKHSRKASLSSVSGSDGHKSSFNFLYGFRCG